MTQLPDQLPGLRLQEAMTDVGVPAEVFLPIIRRFAEVNADFSTRLEMVFQVGDLGKLREMTHSLKSSSGGIGAHKLQDSCLDLEMAAHQGEDPAVLTELISKVNKDLAQVLDSIKSLG